MTVSGATRLPSICTGFTLRGCAIRRRSESAVFTRIIARESLRPPQVLPAQPPISISMSSIHLEYCGQRV